MKNLPIFKRTNNVYNELAENRKIEIGGIFYA